MIHYASFRYCGENYIAVGEQEYRLSVYVENSPGQYARHGRTLWPSWSRFMDGGEVEDYEEGSVSHIDDLEPMYQAVARQHVASLMALARFSDNPFQPVNPSPEQLDWYAKRDEALRLYRESGDASLAIEIGLFPSHEGETTRVGDGQVEESIEGEGDGMILQKMIMGIDRDEFEITRTSLDSAIVELLCDEHEHEEYIVGRIECQKGWGVGREDKGYPHDGGTFWEAVEHCANELSEECESLKAIEEVEEFFENEAVPDLKDRLEALAAFLPVFEEPGFEFGRMILLPGDQFHYEFSEEASRFVQTCHYMKWVKSFAWSKWNETPEAVSLREEPASLQEATHVQLEKLLTALILQERFIGGSLARDFESSLLTRILRRASALLGIPIEKESAAPHMDGNGSVYDLKRDQDLRVRFNLADGYSIWAGASQVTCQPFGVETYEVLTPISDHDGTEIRIMMEESVHYCPHPVKAEYHIHDQGDTMRSPHLFKTQISGDLKLSIEKILTEYGVSEHIR